MGFQQTLSIIIHKTLIVDDVDTLGNCNKLPSIFLRMVYRQSAITLLKMRIFRAPPLQQQPPRLYIFCKCSFHMCEFLTDRLFIDKKAELFFQGTRHLTFLIHFGDP